MSDAIQAIRGMHDILPTETPYWQLIESIAREVVSQYAYREIRFPIVEQTRLFKRSIGDATDIVEKEMYTFEDRNGDSLTLRPEGTAGCVRAGIEQGLLYNQVQRFWYLGPMFRHERPQKGRCRQFHQLGVEAFGLAGPDIDAELILLSKRLLERLGLYEDVVLELNTLGTLEERAAYQEKLVAYFTQHENQLDEDSKRRLTKNPLRILDSKNPDMKAIIQAAPSLMDFLGEVSRAHFDKLCDILRAAKIHFKVNPTIVRGLDYYGLTVFEWVTTHLGAQGTVCAGGRYDGLVKQLGGKETPAIGFAMGIERIALLLQEKQKIIVAPDFYVVSDGSATVFAFLERLRSELPHCQFESYCGNAGFGAQFKKADKSGAKFALILGNDEVTNQSVTLKNLVSGEQRTLVITAFVQEFAAC